MDERGLGEVAYEGYRSASKSLISGAEIPAWPDLPEDIRKAWEASAQSVTKTLWETCQVGTSGRDDVYRIVGGPEGDSIKVFDPDGAELPGVLSITALDIDPRHGARVRLEVLGELNVTAEREYSTEFFINGIQCGTVTQALSYTDLCILAGVDPEKRPAVIRLVPASEGPDQVISYGESVAVRRGMRFCVYCVYTPEPRSSS